MYMLLAFTCIIIVLCQTSNFYKINFAFRVCWNTLALVTQDNLI